MPPRRLNPRSEGNSNRILSRLRSDATDLPDRCAISGLGFARDINNIEKNSASLFLSFDAPYYIIATSREGNINI